MRSSIVLASCIVLGCSSGDGAVDPTDDASAIDSSDDTSTSSDARDDARDTFVATDGAGDVTTDAIDSADAIDAIDATDALPAACEGFTTKPLVPPVTCDKASGNTTSEKSPNGLYSTSNFGCYRKADGTIYKDPSDNCLFACGDMGLCPGTADGPSCEAALRWFTADADRFGCGKRIRLTNCLNGKRAIAVALDRGPNCKNEQTYGVPVIDMGHDLMTYLFDGKLYGGVDKKRILVEEVPSTTKLGPE